jgi:hypothetical protein
MAWGQKSVTARSLGDARKSAIGEAILAMIRAGIDGPWEQLCARLQREGGEAAAKRVKSAMADAAGVAPPLAVIIAKPQMKARAKPRKQSR